MEKTSRVIKNVKEKLEHISNKAFSHVELRCNPLLSRNPYESSLLKHKLCNKPMSPSSWHTHLQYWVGGVVRLGGIGVCALAYKWGRKKTFSSQTLHKVDFLLDTFTILPKTNSAGKHQELYIATLIDTLQKNHHSYIHILRPYGSKNPLEYMRLGRCLRQEEYFVTEYDVLDWRMWIALWAFLIRYKRLAMQMLKTHPWDDTDIKHAFEASLATSPVTAFMRYLLAQKLSQHITTPKRCIMWYENQRIDSLFISGLDRDKITIDGIQALLNYPLYINLRPSSEEVRHRMAPDRILVNGKANVYPMEGVEVCEGVSFRYGALFCAKKALYSGERVTVLLPYLEEDIQNIITFLKRLSSAFSFREHPAKPCSKMLKAEGIEGEYMNDTPLINLLDTSALVITSGSGTAMEAAVRGCSVLIIKGDCGFTTNPMPAQGYGEIWAECFASDEQNLVNDLLQFRTENPQRINALSTFYRNHFFSEPTEERISHLFGIL